MLGFLLIALIVIVVDLGIAFLAMLIGPLTGIFFLQELTYWNWFAIVVLTQVLGWTATVN